MGHASRPLEPAQGVPREEARVRREYNVLALIKGNERYVFVYDDESRQSLVDAFRDQAADPRLSLTWFDATVLTEKAHEQSREGPVESPSPRPRL